MDQFKQRINRFTSSFTALWHSQGPARATIRRDFNTGRRILSHTMSIASLAFWTFAVPVVRIRLLQSRIDSSQRDN